MGHRFLVTKLDCIGDRDEGSKNLLGMLSRAWMLLNYGAQFFKTFISAQTERKFTFAIINDDELSLRQAAFLPLRVRNGWWEIWGRKLWDTQEREHFFHKNLNFKGILIFSELKKDRERKKKFRENSKFWNILNELWNKWWNRF